MAFKTHTQPHIGGVRPPITGHKQKSALHPYRAQPSNQPVSSSLGQALKKSFSPSFPSPDEFEASLCCSYRLHKDHPTAFSQPCRRHPSMQCFGREHTASKTLIYLSCLQALFFFYIPSCLMLPAARHSCFLASQLFFRIVAHTAVPPNAVASYPEGRLVQDSFPFESSFCLSRKDDSFLSSPPALLQ